MMCVNRGSTGFIAEVVLEEKVSYLLYRGFQDIFGTEGQEQKVRAHD